MYSISYLNYSEIDYINETVTFESQVTGENQICYTNIAETLTGVKHKYVK